MTLMFCIVCIKVKEAFKHESDLEIMNMMSPTSLTVIVSRVCILLSNC